MSEPGDGEQQWRRGRVGSGRTPTPTGSYGPAPGKATLTQHLVSVGPANATNTAAPGKGTLTQLLAAPRAEAIERGDAQSARASVEYPDRSAATTPSTATPSTATPSTPAPVPLPRLELGRRGARSGPTASGPAASAPAPTRGAQPSGARGAGAADAAAEVGAWVGASKAGHVFRNTSVETYSDPATKRGLTIETRWMLAELEQFELKTNAAMEVDRRISIQLARSSVVIKSRMRVLFHADRIPNDVHAALHAPARHLTHEGAIFVTDDQGAHLMRSVAHPRQEEPSAASYLAREPMLGYGTPPAQRLAEAEHFVSSTVPTYEHNLELIAAILRDAPDVAIALRRYIQAKLAYESPPPEALARGRHLIARLEELTRFQWTGHEGHAVHSQLLSMWQGFTGLVQQAVTATPAAKGLLDHAGDLVKAIGKAGAGVVTALKELGLMARDLGLWTADRLAGAFGYEIDWSAASSIGKAYEAGTSTSEIFAAIVTGLLDSWTAAIEHAENGDYSKLMDLGAELTLDLAIGAATAGVAVSGAAAKRAGTTAQLAEGALVVSEPTIAAITRRTQAVLQRAQQAVTRAPERARAALLDTIDTAEGWLTGLRESVKLADTGAGALRVIDKSAIGQAIQRSRGARALDSARAAMTKLRGGTARAQGASVIARLEKLAQLSKMPEAVYAVARRIAEQPDKAKFVAALDKLLTGSARTLEPEVVSGVLRRAADAVDPVAFLDNVDWVMARTGLSSTARKSLVSLAVRYENPLDLSWLRALTELPDKMLEYMATTPGVQWQTFMKVSKKPSDYFPSDLKKKLTHTDYRDAAAKLRGLAGEMMFVVEGVELPGGLKIAARQVDIGGKTIDFMLQDSAGRRAMLEIKAWTPERWSEQLTINATGLAPQGYFRNLVAQLRAATSEGDPVYLAVPDTIGPFVDPLKNTLARYRLRPPAVIVVTFPAGKLKEVSATLRSGLALSSFALVTATQADKDGAEDE